MPRYVPPLPEIATVLDTSQPRPQRSDHDAALARIDREVTAAEAEMRRMTANFAALPCYRI